jgi:hypothetical protein
MYRHYYVSVRLLNAKLCRLGQPPVTQRGKFVTTVDTDTHKLDFNGYLHDNTYCQVVCKVTKK